jgi:hypothetical protein
MNNKKVYILYKYNKFKSDLEYIKEYYNKKEILEDNIIKLKNKYSLNQYIFARIEDIKKILNDKYIIIVEDLKDL